MTQWFFTLVPVPATSLHLPTSTFVSLFGKNYNSRVSNLSIYRLKYATFVVTNMQFLQIFHFTVRVV